MNLASLIKEKQTDPEAWRYTDLAALTKADGVAVPEASVTFPDALGTGITVPFLDGKCAKGGMTDQQGRVFLQMNQGTPQVEMIFALSGKMREAGTEVLIEVESGTEAVLIQRFCGAASAEPSIELPEMKIMLGAKAHLTLITLVDGGGVYLGRTQIDLAADAEVESFSLLTGRKLARNDVSVRLGGVGAVAKMRGVMIAAGKQQVDTVCNVLHDAERTTSEQIFKTVLDGPSRGVFLGKICVLPQAQKTDGQQTSRALLLSDQAEMIAKPELEIEADDVKCGHGSTVGDLDEAELFYLRARGIPKPQARQMLIAAFLAEIVETLADPSVRRAAQKMCGYEDGAEVENGNV